MIPIGDTTRAHGVPYVNYALIAINAIVFLYEIALSGQNTVFLGVPVTELDRFIFHWGNIPECTLDDLGIQAARGVEAALVCREQPQPASTPLTAMFMHVGWAHILGNMLFLWVFGDNLEDAMGHLLYAAFYLICGIGAAAAHGWVNQDSLTPAVGASGAVAGVMGGYILLFPRATVTAIVPPFFFLPLPIPAFLLIGIWFVLQIFGGFSELAPTAEAGGGIAYFAHIGGFVAGVALVNVFASNRRRIQRQQAPRYRDYW
ncbi:MAG TPA: rhomboid family intramembrane serine protease [Dehalococcoidia bacterium]|nr:rhomboid family intramembrane serine protease [Dehalococcoidia bacterium]